MPSTQTTPRLCLISGTKEEHTRSFSTRLRRRFCCGPSNIASNSGCSLSWGKKNVLADTLSRSRQVLGAEWTLHQEVVQSLVQKWPANVDLFATSMNFRLPTYFSPISDPQAAGVDSFLQNWSNLQAYAFPPFPTIRQVLNKARESRNLHLTLVAPMWRQKEWFRDLQGLCREPPIPLPIRWDLLRQPHIHRFHLSPQALQLHTWRLVID